jgi:hypothetical protein
MIGLCFCYSQSLSLDWSNTLAYCGIWGCTHNISLSLLLTNRPNKLDCLSLVSLSTLVLHNSLDYLADS